MTSLLRSALSCGAVTIHTTRLPRFLAGHSLAPNFLTMDPCEIESRSAPCYKTKPPKITANPNSRLLPTYPTYPPTYLLALLGCFMFAPLAPLGPGLEKIACFHRCVDAQENYFYETQWKMSTEKMQGKWFQEPNAANVCHVPHGDKFMSLCYLSILWKQACIRVGAGACFLRLI